MNSLESVAKEVIERHIEQMDHTPILDYDGDGYTEDFPDPDWKKIEFEIFELTDEDEDDIHNMCQSLYDWWEPILDSERYDFCDYKYSQDNPYRSRGLSKRDFF